ncbi:aldehyde dehydrogenase family protein, partial [Staphylococcus pasteuri]|uniref:aldehyde dehydrogenase family protein n=1 Tax=Staphylococcus pasteuri TaxID=45972 RepID=UPI0012B8F378
NPLHQKTHFPPIINQTQLNTIHQKLQHPLNNPPKLLLRTHKLHHPPYFYPPTLLHNLKQTHTAFKEQIFPPLLPITT